MKYYVDFITKQAIAKLTSFEKIKMIIRLVRQNRVLILESGLTPEEEVELIKQTMAIIDFNNFIGVEFFNWRRRTHDVKRVFRKSPQNDDTKYTVVAPSSAVHVIDNIDNLLSIEFSSNIS